MGMPLQCDRRAADAPLFPRSGEMLPVLCHSRPPPATARSGGLAQRCSTTGFNPAPWCMNNPAAASVRRFEDQRIRTEAGMPKLVIRLNTLHPIFASVRCAGRVRA